MFVIGFFLENRTNTSSHEFIEQYCTAGHIAELGMAYLVLSLPDTLRYCQLFLIIDSNVGSLVIRCQK